MYQVGISWPQWIADPLNKKLFESNQAEALKKFKNDEEEYIHELILQERIQQEQLIEQQESVISSPGIGSAAGGAGGFTFNTGIGNFAIGTFLNSEGVSINELVDEGFERFTVG